MIELLRKLAVVVVLFASLATTSGATGAKGDWWLPRQADRFLTGRNIVYRGEITARVRIVSAHCVGAGPSATPGGGSQRWARFTCFLRGRTADRPATGRITLWTNGRYKWRRFTCCAP